MKKLIILMLLSISVFTLISCDSDDDGRRIEDNYGNVSYRGYNIPFYHAYITELEGYKEGNAYSIELSTNPLNRNGRNIGAYVYLEIYVAFNNSLSGDYSTDVPDLSRRKLDFFEFHVDPVIQGNEVVSSTFSTFNTFFSSGSLQLNSYNDGFLRTNFRMVDQERFILNGNFEGFEEFISRKSNVQQRSNIQGTGRVSRSKKLD